MMRTHTYIDLKHGVLHSVDYRCSNGHLIHECFTTIFYDDICWC
ncbi:hypothetical protein [Burkholderia gladioli]|uniref:Uncharacterized protein n=1 Tax=Burkholderia gladioli TaxID=28095 RepID=A0AB38U5Q7_BURGA|nr:hypothetical protein [Burkholderia gladioli]UWX68857.1 hypothetical protein NYZ96_11470 [Burkholderia gladioli]UWX75339.1 hypothetical protein NYZ96_35240 [Burkholderia gladioli]